MNSTLHFLFRIPDVELSRGNTHAYTIASEICASVPQGCSVEVQLACAIAAIESDYDYDAWPSTWTLANILPNLVSSMANAAPDSPTKFQRRSYNELYQANPRLLERLEQGFTGRISLHNPQNFIHHLVKAGAGQCPIGDELHCTQEDGVLHVAMSYRHCSPGSSALSTISPETAQEVYEIILSMPQVTRDTKVRVWVDQNLRRYSHEGPWHRRGFLPYVVIPVVSALSSAGGLSAGRTRPWIWLETSLALCSYGIHARKETLQSRSDIIEIPEDSMFSPHVAEHHGKIPGIGQSVVHSIREALRIVSLWSVDVLDHNTYDARYVPDFIRFSQWAKAQTLRLDGDKYTKSLDLTSDELEENILEEIAWIRSLRDTSMQRVRELTKAPYIRLEMKSEKCARLVSLIRACGKCQEYDGVEEMVGQFSGLETFCFREMTGTTSLHINPSPRGNSLRIGDAESCVLDEEYQRFITQQGGYSLWEARVKGKPKIEYCGRIFCRQYGMRDMLGVEEANIEIGGFRFMSDSFMTSGSRFERIYSTKVEGDDVYITESDVLCMRMLSEEIQKEIVQSLSVEKLTRAVSRIMRIEEGVHVSSVERQAIGTKSAEIMSIMSELRERCSIGQDEIILRRARIAADMYLISVQDEEWGHSIYSFKSSLEDGSNCEDLVGFRTGGDIDGTVRKVGLMMGCVEWNGFRSEGICIGTGIRDENGRKFEGRIRLEGSELWLCSACQNVYSPVTGKIAIVSSRLIDRRVRVVWGGEHTCGNNVGICCDIRGVAA